MIGRTIAHYRIFEALGQGGMGVVYKAEDTRLLRTVALKFLPESLRTDPNARTQFLREARAASRLKHPNVLTIYTVEESEAGDFIAMEYAEGGTLRARVGALSIPEACEYLGQAAEALQAAHERGIIHRDIKPDNLLIDAEGRLRISDFGLARLVSDVSSATHADVAVGTAHYMSPEQVTGNPIDGRSDIFALGVTFFELLSGRRPFEGDYIMSVLYAIANEPAPRLSEFDPSIPAELDAIIARCLAKSPSERFESCRKLAVEVAQLRSAHVTLAQFKDETADAAVGVGGIDELRPLIGRQDELAHILRFLQPALDGRGYSVFLTGESGIGKTRLAEAAIAEGRRRGMGVLSGRCLPQGGGLPFHAYASALRNGLPRLSEGLAGTLEKRAQALGIDLRNRIPILRSFLNMSGPIAVINQEQLWDSLLVLLRVISAERPVILFLDDLQWADDDTLRFFGFVARNAPELPLLQLATYRVVEANEPHQSISQALSALVRQLHGDGYADLVEVGRLRPDDTVRLASELLDRPLDDPEFAATLARRTDGNPLFVHELVQLIRQSSDLTNSSDRLRVLIPERVRDIVAQRIERLSAPDRELLEFASCELEVFESDTLSECLKLERIPLLRNLQRLELSHRLIRHDGARYRFDHPLIREVIYNGILPELREEFHRLIAQSLIARHGESSEHASRIVHHLASSGQRFQSVEYLFRAAERAHDLCANTEALRLYQDLESAIREGASLSSRDQLRFRIGYGDTLLAKGRIEDAQHQYEGGLELAKAAGDTEATIDLACRLSAPYRMRGDLERACQTALVAAGLARERIDVKRLAESLTALAMANIARAEYGHAIAYATEVAQLAQRAGDVHQQSVGFALLGAVYFHTGKYQQAAIHLDRAIDMQRSTGDQRGLAASLNFSGLAYHRLARFSRSVLHHLESLRIKRTIQDVSAIPGGLNGLGDVYRDMGQLELAYKQHTESLMMARLHSNRGAECDNLRDLGVDYLLVGEFDKAVATLEEAATLSKEYKYPWYETRAFSTLSAVYLAMGDVKRADEYADQAYELATHVNAIELLAEALLAKARVLALAPESASAAIDHVRRGIMIAEQGGLVLPLRALQLTLATLLVRQGDRDGAVVALAAARDLLEEAAGNLDDPSERRVFLELPESREILSLSAEIGNGAIDSR